MTTSMKYSDTPESITYFSEFEGDRRHLGRNPEKRQESDTEYWDASWAETPEVRSDETDEEYEKMSGLCGHLYSTVNTFSVP